MSHEVLIENSLDVMRSLRDKLDESIGLAALLDDSPGEGIILARVEGMAGVSVHFEVNFRFPLHIAAPAKAMLAAMPIEDARGLIEKIEFTRFTDNTIVDPDAMMDELSQIRRRGYAIDLMEHNAGCHCVAAVIVDADAYPVAGIWVSSFANRMPVERFDEVSKHIVQAAQKVSARLAGEDWQRDAFARAAIDDAKQYLADHLTENIDIEAFAKSRRLSYSWFRSRFKLYTGVSPKQYHLRLRMDEAKRLLASTDFSVKEVAVRLGYDNQDYFSAIFKRKEGSSPSEYRDSVA